MKKKPRQVHRYMSAQYSSEQVSTLLDFKEPILTPKGGQRRMQPLECREHLTTISRMTEDNFFDEALNMNMAPFLSNSSPKMDL